MSQSLGEKYFSAIPISRCGEYTGKIKCPCHYEFWRHVEGIFRGVKNKIIIDLGCGPGLKSLTLALAGANVIAIDNSSRRLSEFKKNLAITENLWGELKISVYCRDLRKQLSFLDSDSADYILCYEVIEHLNDARAIVHEMARIIKPGGHILITAPNKKACPVEPKEKIYG
ncbi:MAG: hypothetical protein COS29_04645 [Candidatus Omnitrophica bacterium CG02_land_8_20_14_3_00__42_8]|nr:MAG: hypothetical protein COS29_04645 [Candidatus Omnitrophica bacterium CG02_land_8_20_14_3_00__42_8]